MTEAPTPMPPASPKKSGNTVILVVAAVVVLCCVCIGIALLWQYGDALLKAMGLL
jgi:capsular polysaccharide biosynthesis protein